MYSSHLDGTAVAQQAAESLPNYPRNHPYITRERATYGGQDTVCPPVFRPISEKLCLMALRYIWKHCLFLRGSTCWVTPCNMLSFADFPGLFASVIDHHGLIGPLYHLFDCSRSLFSVLTSLGCKIQGFSPFMESYHMLLNTVDDTWLSARRWPGVSEQCNWTKVNNGSQKDLIYSPVHESGNSSSQISAEEKAGATGKVSRFPNCHLASACFKSFAN